MFVCWTPPTLLKILNATNITNFAFFLYTAQVCSSAQLFSSRERQPKLPNESRFCLYIRHQLISKPLTSAFNVFIRRHNYSKLCMMLDKKMDSQNVIFLFFKLKHLK